MLPLLYNTLILIFDKRVSFICVFINWFILYLFNIFILFIILLIDSFQISSLIMLFSHADQVGFG